MGGGPRSINGFVENGLSFPWPTIPLPPLERFLSSSSSGAFLGGDDQVADYRKAGERNGVQSNVHSSSINTVAAANDVVKGHWMIEEDSLLLRSVKPHGARKWSLIAKKLVGRIGKQCRERWHNHLRPNIKKDTWTEEEERLLVEAHEKVGNRWAAIAQRIPGRTENSIQNHWNATKRRKNSRRKGKERTGQGEKTQPTILQEYIRSKSLEDTCTTKTTSSTFPLSQSDIFHVTFQEPPAYCRSTLSSTTIVDENTCLMDNFLENPCSQQSVNASVQEEGFHVGDFQDACVPGLFDSLGFDEDNYQLLGMDGCTLPVSPRSTDFLYKEAIAPASVTGYSVTDTTVGTHLDYYISCLPSGAPSHLLWMHLRTASEKHWKAKLQQVAREIWI